MKKCLSLFPKWQSWTKQGTNTKFFYLILSTERLPVPAVDLVARRIRARARRRKRSAATVHRRTRTAAGVAAPRAKRSRKKGRRARRKNPGPDLALAPGLALDQESKIALGNLARRAASSPRVMTREASPRGALVPVHTRLPSPNPEPGLNQSPNPNPVPPHLPKPAPAPAPPPVQSPAPNPAPRLVPAPVPAPSSEFGLFVLSPYPTVSSCPPFTFPKHYPCLLFLINSCRIPGTLLDVLSCTCYSISFGFYAIYFFIRAVLCGGVCKITGCNLSFISLNDDVCLSFFFFKSHVEAYCFVKMLGGSIFEYLTFVKSSYHFISNKKNACSTFVRFVFLFFY